MNSNRVYWVDGVKGLACLLIFLHHFSVGFYPASYFGETQTVHSAFDLAFSQSPFSFFCNGNFLVHIFCLLSGFVITYSFSGDMRKLSNSVFKRYFYLSLSVLSVSLLVLILYKLNLFSNMSAAQITGSSNWLGVYYNSPLTLKNAIQTSFIDVWFYGNAEFNTVFWMLTYILRGSAITYLINIALQDKKEGALVFVLVFVTIYYHLKSLNAVFCCGIILAKLYKKYAHKTGWIASTIGMILILIGCFFGGYPTGIQPTNIYTRFGFTDYYSPHFIGAVLTVAGIMLCKPVVRLLSTKVFIFLGNISFPVYLLHIPITFTFGTSFFLLLYKENVNYHWGSILTFIATLVLVIGISYLYHATVEKAITKLLKTLSNRLRRQRGQ